jgi:hypothetical protein
MQYCEYFAPSMVFWSERQWFSMCAIFYDASPCSHVLDLNLVAITAYNIIMWHSGFNALQQWDLYSIMAAV